MKVKMRILKTMSKVHIIAVAMQKGRGKIESHWTLLWLNVKVLTGREWENKWRGLLKLTGESVLKRRQSINSNTCTEGESIEAVVLSNFLNDTASVTHEFVPSICRWKRVARDSRVILSDSERWWNRVTCNYWCLNEKKATFEMLREEKENEITLCQ